jgi:hypothetical protein
VATGGTAGEWDVLVADASPDRPRAQALHEAVTAARARTCVDQAGPGPYELVMGDAPPT